MQRGMIVDACWKLLQRSMDNKGKYESREMLFNTVYYIQYRVGPSFFTRIAVIRSRSNVSIEF